MSFISLLIGVRPRIAEGRIKVLSNVDVFTEGFDLPAIDAVILMRPTKSLALFLQMIGRALRQAPGKPEALVFDHAGLWLEHGRPDTEMPWGLEGGARHQRLAAMRANGGHMRRCPECKEVRAEREPVCACGFEFPTGREIGEYDGQLWELRGGVPEGFETLTQFSKRIGASEGIAWSFVRRGMPTHLTQKNLVNIESGLIWAKENAIGLAPWDVENRDEYESVTDFCTRTGISRSVITKLKAEGLPHHHGGYVHIDAALSFLVQRNSPTLPPQDVDDRGEYESKAHFARRANISPSTVQSWIKSGMPAARNGWVHIGRASRWIETSLRTIKSNPFGIVSIENCMSQSSFGERHNLSHSTISNLVKRGLPVKFNGLVDIAEGNAWLEKNYDKSRTPFAQLGAVEFGTERLVDFAKRVGSKRGTVFYWKKFRGLPCASNGWVHIRKGLEWVRDNTNIKIPPEAWPAANGSGDSAADAA